MGGMERFLEELDVDLRDLLSRAPELQIFGEYSEKVMKTKVLDKKFKELIALGISIANSHKVRALHVKALKRGRESGVKHR